MNLTCRQLLIYLNKGSIEIQAKQFTKRAKKHYRRGRLSRAVVHLSYAYALGSEYAVRSLHTLIEKNMLGEFKLRESKKETKFVLNSFKLIRGLNMTHLARFGDLMFYGLSFGGKNFEKYENSFDYYNASWRANKDFYGLYSTAFMLQKGLGVEKDSKKAFWSYFEIVKAGVVGNASLSSVVPSGYGCVEIGLGWAYEAVLRLVENLRSSLLRSGSKVRQKVLEL